MSLLLGNLVVIQPTSFSMGRAGKLLGVIKTGLACPISREAELIQTVPCLGPDGLKRDGSPT